METDSLPEKGSPAATARSPEDEDLLQRSTKKTKRPRGSKETLGQSPLAETSQEAAFFAGLKSPDSTQWHRRGQRKMDNRTPGAGARGGTQAQKFNTNSGNLETGSRFAALEQLIEPDETQTLEGNRPTIIDTNPIRNLPNIRTNNHPRSQFDRRPNDRSQQGRQPQPTNRGGASGGRIGRGGAPRRAAELEHTVVRGSRNGKQVISTVVHHQRDSPEPSYRAEEEYDALGEPPDPNDSYANNQMEADTDMIDDTGQIGHMDHEGPDM
nr:uncharacterized protein LOC109192823 [Ipomoea trifida]